MLEKQVSEMWAQLANKLGVASEKIWEWALLQVKVEIAQGLIIALIAVVLDIVAVKYYWNVRKSPGFDGWDYWVFNSFPRFLGNIALVIALCTFTALAIYGVYSLPQYIINPEYAALKDILSQLSALK